MRRSTAAAAVVLAFVLMLTSTAAASTPTISYSIDGTVGTNGWYRGSSHGDDVIVHWSVSLDATSTNCLAAVAIPGPTPARRSTCWAQNADGRTTAVTRLIRIDATPPTGLTEPSRAHLTTTVGTTTRSRSAGRGRTPCPASRGALS